MLGSEILEVAIGLVFMYLLLCFVCSAIQEVLAAIFKLRARNLARALKGLLGPEWTAKVLNHGMIRGMRPLIDEDNKLSDLEELTESIKKGAFRLFPSYIPGRTFASIMVDLIAQEPHAPAGAAGPAAANAKSPVSLTPAIQLSSDAVSHGLRQGLATLQESQLRQAFRAILAGTDADLAKACAAIQNWYDDSMERASGWYKRRVQWCLAGIGFAVVVCTNADSISIAKALAVDDELRRTVADNATQYIELASEDCDAVNVGADSVEQTVEHVEVAFDRLNASGLPLGWTWEQLGWGTRNPMDPISAVDLRNATWAILYKMPGFLITVFAIMLGAPFWFELLNKLANLRGAGKKPMTRREEEKVEAEVGIEVKGAQAKTGSDE